MRQFLNHLSEYSKTCFNYLNHKKSSPFQSRRMWISNRKNIYQKNYFINAMVIQNSVLIMILGKIILITCVILIVLKHGLWGHCFSWLARQCLWGANLICCLFESEVVD